MNITITITDIKTKEEAIAFLSGAPGSAKITVADDNVDAKQYEINEVMKQGQKVTTQGTKVVDAATSAPVVLKPKQAATAPTQPVRRAAPVKPVAPPVEEELELEEYVEEEAPPAPPQPVRRAAPQQPKKAPAPPPVEEELVYDDELEEIEFE